MKLLAFLRIYGREAEPYSSPFSYTVPTSIFPGNSQRQNIRLERQFFYSYVAYFYVVNIFYVCLLFNLLRNYSSDVIISRFPSM